MATLNIPVGYECEFVDQVPEDYFCKLCKHVAREPTIASCCTEVLCKACIDAIIQDKKPCPSCEDVETESLGPHKKYTSKILALEARCTMKDRGCPWTGQLQHLNAHLDATTGDCQYVDVQCPKKCVQKVQKRNVDAHLANECPNRYYRCPHCNFASTFCVVSKHFDVCRYYPLACPNRCGVTFERDDLEDHMKMCRLEGVECAFAKAGCPANFIRENEDTHMDQNTQKHLALMPAATLKISQDFEQKLREQQEVFGQKLQEQQEVFGQKLQEQQEVFEQTLREQQEVFEKKLEEKDEQIKLVEQKLQEQQAFEKKLQNKQEVFEKKLEEKDEQVKRVEQKLQEQQAFEQKLQDKQEVFEKKLKEKVEQVKRVEQKLQEQQAFEQKLQDKQEVFEKKLKEKDEQVKQVEQKLEKQGQEFEGQLGGQQIEFQKQLQQRDDQIKQNVKEKDEQIKTLQAKNEELQQQVERIFQQMLPMVNKIRSHTNYRGNCVPPHDIQYTNYRKMRIHRFSVDSPSMYTHPGGYMFELTLWAYGYNDGAGTHLSVSVHTLKGDHDAILKFPVKFTITVQLLNQHRDQDHLTRDIQSELTRMRVGEPVFIGADWTFIPLAALEWNRDKQTQYLKDDCLKFRITNIIVH